MTQESSTADIVYGTDDEQPNSNDPSMETDEEQVEAEKKKRLFGGKMTETRMANVNAITAEALTIVHKAISTAPEESVRAKTPEGLRVKLLPHQQHGLAWMLWRERQWPPTGILGDDMGLGKTLATISLIVHRKNEQSKQVAQEDLDIQKRSMLSSHLTPSHASLIVAPASVVMQWEKELKDRVDGRLRFYVCHGQNRERSPKILAKYDIVLTTYGILTSESASSDNPFLKIGWERIILDEAHSIKNRNAKISKNVCDLNAVYRWCLTGTPIHNELWDLFSLIRFMRISPFSEEAHWKMYIMNSRGNNERLNILVKGFLLRRTKTQIDSLTDKPIIQLPARNFAVVKLKMEGVEDFCYQQMFEASRQRVQQFINEGEGAPIYRNRKNKLPVVKNPFVFGQRELAGDDNFKAMNFFLVLLLRLRQACVHLSLTRQAIDLKAFKNEDGGGDLDNEVLKELEETLEELNLTDQDADDEHNKEVEAVFRPNYLTAKIQAVLSHLDEVIEKKEKCVIVSQWTTVLTMLEGHLKDRKIRFTSITGSIVPKNRQKNVDDFNRKDGGPSVMLLSLSAGGVGLNLIGGNHLFIVDLHWNPAAENQACDRIYRVGQTRDVFIHKFVVENTIEERVLNLQEKKMELADSVLKGAASKNLTKLSMADLKFLFQLDRRGNVPKKDEKK